MDRYIGRIPVRNLWLLMLYASELFRIRGADWMAVEQNPDELPDLVATLLADAVEKRLHRPLTVGYQPQQAVLNRVRGRIDLLATERQQGLARGRVVCRFSALTFDTSRNRLVRAALLKISSVVRPTLAHRCRRLANGLSALGVSGNLPTRAELSADRFGRHDAEDKLMVAAAKLALELSLPTESAGTHWLPLPEREITWVRHLFEKAIGGFYRVTLRPDGWQVRCGQRFGWQISQQTAGIARLLPAMQTDVILENIALHQRIIIDTKFNAIVTTSRFKAEVLRSGYLYQIYAYLRSQTGQGDSLADHASGLLLHPSVDGDVDETVVIQNHNIRFATVNLAGSTTEIRAQLFKVYAPVFWG
jgi:5-methylcytosine-specific restriction enzyme subunit McrC